MASRKDVYTEEQKDEICAHVLMEVGAGRAVHTILENDEGLCSYATFWRGYYADEELRNKVAHAREHGVEAMMEQARHVAATPMPGEIVTHKQVMGADGPEDITERRVEDMLGHRKLLVDTLFKSAQMLKPKTYGPKLDMTSNGKHIGVPEALRIAEERDRLLTDRRSKGDD